MNHAASRHRVLVVDDNVNAAVSLGMLLKLAGQEVRVAYDGPAAFRQATDFRPELVLLDIGMPGMDGYEVCRRLRRESGLEQDDRRRADRLGPGRGSPPLARGRLRSPHRQAGRAQRPAAPARRVAARRPAVRPRPVRRRRTAPASRIVVVCPVTAPSS